MRRSPGTALAWEIWRRHRWGFATLAAFLVALAAIRLRLAGAEPSQELFAFTVIVPLTAAMLYCVAVFSFGLGGDIASRESLFPERLFTLPVQTTTLVAVPMAGGAACVSLTWFVARAVGPWPRATPVAIVWPAILAMVFVAWTQVFTWMRYPLRGIRIALCAGWLVTVDAAVLVSRTLNVSDIALASSLAPLAAIAFFVARASVTRARHSGIVAPRAAAAPAITARSARAFDSPVAAQLWLEWRSYGRALPTWVAIVTSAELALLFAIGDTPALVAFVFGLVLVTPVFMAAVVAPSVRRTTPQRATGREAASFVATRPLADATLVGAKLRACAASTVAAWIITLALLPLGLRITGTWTEVFTRASAVATMLGAARTVVAVLVSLLVLLVATWKQLVQGLFVGLSRREWLVRASLIATLTFLFALGPVLQWVASTPRAEAALWDALPFVLAVVASLKLLAAARVSARLERLRLLSDRQRLTMTALWCGATLALYAMLAWFVGTALFPRYVTMSVAVLVMPILRISAAPVALYHNRHR